MFTGLKNWVLSGRKLRIVSKIFLDQQVRHVIAETDHILAVLHSTEGLLIPEVMERLKVLFRTLDEIKKLSQSG